MSENEIVQSKFQKFIAKLSKITFFIWVGNISMFIISIFYVTKLTSATWFDYVFFGNILMGVMAFIVSIVSYAISRPRREIDTKSLLNTFVVFICGILLITALSFIPIDSSSGSANGARLFSSPLPPITTNTSPKPTFTPKTKGTTAQPKTQKITCIGPDYKEFQATADECAKFRTDWGLSASATPWPTINPQTTTNNQMTSTSNYNYDYNKYPLCTIYYPALNYSQTYQYFTKEMCDSSKKNAENPFTIPVPTPTPTSMPTPQPTVNNQEMCYSLVAEWQNNKEVFYEQNYNNYSSSAEAIFALINMMQPYQNALNNLGCNRTLTPY